MKNTVSTSLGEDRAGAGAILCLLAMLPGLACLPSARAQGAQHAVEGVWIWDRALYVPPPGMFALTHMVEASMSASRDAGAHSTGQIRRVGDDGGVTILAEAFAEDGRDHPGGTSDPPTMVRASALPDGGPHVASGYPGERHDSLCHVSEGGLTLTCTGTHMAPDGSTGDNICVYHRGPHVIPIASSARRGVFAWG